VLSSVLTHTERQNYGCAYWAPRNSSG